MRNKCKIASLLGITILLWMVILLAQAPEPLWTNIYGGRGDDVSYSVQETSDGRYIVVGYTDSFGEGRKDVYLLKTDADGNTLWEETYGGADDEWGHSMIQISDGGYIIVGSKRSAAADKDVYLIKVDENRKLRWGRTYGGASDDVGYSVQETSDGGYIIAGYTYSERLFDTDFYLIKTDAKGRTLWERTYGGTDSDKAYSVRVTPDGGYIVAGYTVVEWVFGRGELDADAYLIRTDADGDILWEMTYGWERIEWGNSVQTTSDGGYIIAGYTTSTSEGDADVYLIKTDAEGDTLWTETYGGPDDDWGYSVQETADGGYIVGGYAKSFGEGDADIYLIKTDAEGDILWTGIYGGTDDDVGYSVQETADGGYIVAGSRMYGSGINDVYLVKTKPMQ